MERKVLHIADNFLQFSKIIRTGKGLCLLQKRVSVNNGKISMKITKRYI